MPQELLNCWISYATDVLGYSEEESEELYMEYDGDLLKFLTPEEVELMRVYTE